MITIGLDFDNTIVQYDNLFCEVARRYGYISDDGLTSKEEVKEYIHKNYSSDRFTLLQGIVYGEEIEKAKPSKNVVDVLNRLKTRYRLKIISHKTKYPILGKRIDLHQAARRWLTIHGICRSENGVIDSRNVFFEDTVDRKIERIVKEGCQVYIDDLAKILRLLPTEITGLHYFPSQSRRREWDRGPTLRDFDELEELLNVVT